MKRSATRKVCVYCASSRQADGEYADSAYCLGRLLAENGITIVYGGGSVGSMGALADGALSSGGKVIGVLPQFMYDLEWGHSGLTELRVVNDLHERKRLMIEDVDATVALPGRRGPGSDPEGSRMGPRCPAIRHPLVHRVKPQSTASSGPNDRLFARPAPAPSEWGYGRRWSP